MKYYKLHMKCCCKPFKQLKAKDLGILRNSKKIPNLRENTAYYPISLPDIKL